MLFEAMLAGQRHLYDAGYKKTAEGTTDEDAGDEAGLDIEQQLAVWSTSANYKKAEAQKAWLLIHGEGDPTGRGEGVSFLTTNMKGYFLRRGETEQGRRCELAFAARERLEAYMAKWKVKPKQLETPSRSPTPNKTESTRKKSVEFGIYNGKHYRTLSRRLWRRMKIVINR